MPKNKTRLESSDESSDSGPDDRTPPKKQAKQDPPSKSSSSKGKSSSAADDEESKFVLDKNRFVTVREFRGKTLIDIREYYTTADGETRPGKKGISLNSTQWGKLKSLVGEIDEAVKNM